MNEPKHESGKLKAVLRSVGNVALYIGSVLIAGIIFRHGIANLTNIPDATRSPYWPSVSGEVTVSESVIDDGGIYAPDTTEDLIVSRYLANGQTYSSDRFCCGYGGLPDGLRTMDERLAQFPVGTTVTVYSDPADPANSVLFPGNTYGLLDYLEMALFVLFPGAVLAALVALPLSELIRYFRERRLSSQTGSEDSFPAQLGNGAKR